MKNKELKTLKDIAFCKAIKELAWNGWCEECENDCENCEEVYSLAENMLNFCLNMDYNEKERENLYESVKWELECL